VIVVDVTHATDSPNAPGNRGGDIGLGGGVEIELGGGPVVARGTTITRRSSMCCEQLRRARR